MAKQKLSQKNVSRNILTAFVLNLGFAIFEFIGGSLTGSVAIVSDAVHDMGDAMSIGLSYFLERKSRRRADDQYTYGYLRYSLLGGMVTTLILLLGSSFVIYSAIVRMFDPVEINYDGMIILAIVGVVINSLAAYFTHGGNSLNQKSVNLHMLEDVLGWVVVLVGAIVMKLSNFALIDPLLSVVVAIFILKEALTNFWKILAVFLEKTPRGIDLKELKTEILKLKNVQEAHHLHVWSMDGEHNYATLHVIYEGDGARVKQEIKHKMHDMGIEHTTIELEKPDEKCDECECVTPVADMNTHHHHH